MAHSQPLTRVQVPVFSIAAWRCVWALLPNDLVHAFGVDLAWHVCAGDAGASAIAIVDEQPVDHLGVPSLGEQGPTSTPGQAPWCVCSSCLNPSGGNLSGNRLVAGRACTRGGGKSGASGAHAGRQRSAGRRRSLMGAEQHSSARCDDGGCTQSQAPVFSVRFSTDRYCVSPVCPPEPLLHTCCAA